MRFSASRCRVSFVIKVTSYVQLPRIIISEHGYLLPERFAELAPKLQEVVVSIAYLDTTVILVFYMSVKNIVLTFRNMLTE